MKKRHGCLTAYLVVMLLVNSLSALAYLLGGDAIQEMVPGVSTDMLLILGVLSVVNVICVIGLFQWKMWGFWGFIAVSVIALVINLSIGLGIAQSAFGLVGIAILYGVLQIGNEDKGWPQLE